ncbi:MAG: DsbA family oxidoreductase [Chloroflexota bacterium]
MKIDIFQDTVCPWCRIGKRHLELVLDDWDGEPVEVAYHSFFLDPTLPAEGKDFRSHLQAKIGGQVGTDQLFDVPRERGAAVGLVFNFDAIDRSPNTMLSHQLVAITPDELKTQMVDAVYAAYFEQGRDIGNIEVLLDIAEENGLSRTETQTRLEASEGRDVVLTDVALAQQLGISGVPFFVINDAYGFSGAQPPHMMRRVLEQVAAESVTVTD